MNEDQKLRFYADVQQFVDEATYSPCYPYCVICQLADYFNIHLLRPREQSFAAVMNERYGMPPSVCARIYHGVLGADGVFGPRRPDWAELGRTKEGALKIVQEVLWG